MTGSPCLCSRTACTTPSCQERSFEPIHRSWKHSNLGCVSTAFKTGFVFSSGVSLNYNMTLRCTSILFSFDMLRVVAVALDNKSLILLLYTLLDIYHEQISMNWKFTIRDMIKFFF